MLTCHFHSEHLVPFAAKTMVNALALSLKARPILALRSAVMGIPVPLSSGARKHHAFAHPRIAPQTRKKKLKGTFPGLICNGGLEIRPLHGHSDVPAAHPVDAVAQFHLPGSDHESIASGAVPVLPIANRQEFCIVQLSNGTTINLDPTKILDSASTTGGKLSDTSDGISNPLQDPNP